MYEMAANLTLIVHFAFILFVVFGALLFFVTTKIVFIHIPAFIWGSYIELTHSICPLTYLENWFLHKANLTLLLVTSTILIVSIKLNYLIF